MDFDLDFLASAFLDLVFLDLAFLDLDLTSVGSSVVGSGDSSQAVSSWLAIGSNMFWIPYRQLSVDQTLSSRNVTLMHLADDEESVGRPGRRQNGAAYSPF